MENPPHLHSLLPNEIVSSTIHVASLNPCVANAGFTIINPHNTVSSSQKIILSGNLQSFLVKNGIIKVFYLKRSENYSEPVKIFDLKFEFLTRKFTLR